MPRGKFDEGRPVTGPATAVERAHWQGKQIISLSQYPDEICAADGVRAG